MFIETFQVLIKTHWVSFDSNLKYFCKNCTLFLCVAKELIINLNLCHSVLASAFERWSVPVAGSGTRSMSRRGKGWERRLTRETETFKLHQER